MSAELVNVELVTALEGYLAKRRALGFKLLMEERHMRNFLQWLWASGNTGASFTAAQAAAWVRGEGDFTSGYQHQRLSAVRCFTRYCQALAMDVQVPTTRALNAGRDRRRPHIYSQAEVDALIGACYRVFSHPLVQTTMAHLIGLLAVTGIRPGEALRLRAGDLDVGAATLLIQANKHGPDRVIPLGPTTINALTSYQADPSRQAAGPQPDGPIFVTITGSAYQRQSVGAHFQRIRAAADFTWEGPAPRLSDLRHTFATRQMIRAYTTEAADPAATLSLLATWLGHSDPAHTYWYIEAVPELLALAAGRVDAITTTE